MPDMSLVTVVVPVSQLATARNLGKQLEQASYDLALADGNAIQYPESSAETLFCDGYSANGQAPATHYVQSSWVDDRLLNGLAQMVDQVDGAQHWVVPANQAVVPLIWQNVELLPIYKHLA